MDSFLSSDSRKGLEKTEVEEVSLDIELVDDDDAKGFSSFIAVIGFCSSTSSSEEDELA
uniref:Uncharacterized protein n=1 Tax=Lepeophtheirus salmonis TaxID=72036 RepID=A0A0K2SYT7_LEPSM